MKKGYYAGFRLYNTVSKEIMDTSLYTVVNILLNSDTIIDNLGAYYNGEVFGTQCPIEFMPAIGEGIESARRVTYIGRSSEGWKVIDINGKISILSTKKILEKAKCNCDLLENKTIYKNGLRHVIDNTGKYIATYNTHAMNDRPYRLIKQSLGLLL